MDTRLVLILGLFVVCSWANAVNENRTLAFLSQASEFQSQHLPDCKPVSTTQRPRIAVISHDSAIATFFHNPEQGARDAAAITDVHIDWNRHLVNTGSKMTTDIRNAVDQKVDGIILSIPNDEVFEAAKYALKRRIPMVVFNTGHHYARQLGLTRVLQDDEEAGVMMGQELQKRGYSRPLAIQPSGKLDNITYQNRLAGIRSVIENDPYVISLPEYNNTAQPMADVRNRFLSNAAFDSIISLGGSIGVDIVTGTALDILRQDPDRRVGVAFFDIGGSNMTSLFKTHNDTFAISQLPYYQTALPVFYMYLRLLTGYDVFLNETVRTGPNLVTNKTLTKALESEQTTLIPLNDRTAYVGSVIPNTHGDTFNGALMAGAHDLAHKLNWTILDGSEQGYPGFPLQLKNQLSMYSKQGVNGILLETSDRSVLDYGTTISNMSDLPLAEIGTFYEDLRLPDKGKKLVSSVALDMHSLARRVASTVAGDKVESPVCLVDRTYRNTSTFCHTFYTAYQESMGGLAPGVQHVVHSVNMSTVDLMETEFEAILTSLDARNYTPDAFITFSGSIFDVINGRKLKGTMRNSTRVYTSGDLFDQVHAYLEGRINSFWYTNMFAIGFLSMLNLLLSKNVSFQPWMQLRVGAPRIENVCPPGTYYNNLASNYFCLDTNSHTKVSIQCSPCPANTYAALPNQQSCKPCDYGTFSTPGSSLCTSCNHMANVAANDLPNCAAFASDRSERQRRVLLAILLPISLIILLMLGVLVFWKGRRHWRKRQRLDDKSWLLSYHELVRPSLRHLSSMAFPRDMLQIKKQSSSVDIQFSKSPGVNTGHLSPGIPTNHTNNSEPNLAISSEIKKMTIDSAQSTEHHPCQKPLLIHTLGTHRNLPVYIKQIGTKRVRVDDDVRKEIALMKDARHPKLVEFIGLCLEPHRTFIVEEYCTKGSLANILADPDIDLTWIFRFSLINDLLQGMEFLQRSKFLYHGSLTSEACMISGKWELKITGYGLARVRQSQQSSFMLPAARKNYLSSDPVLSVEELHLVRTNSHLLWLSPESVVRMTLENYISYPSKQADVYSAGMIINEILTREKPFKEHIEKGLTCESVFCQIQDDKLLPRMMDPDHDEYSDKVNGVILECLDRDPAKRPDFSSIRSRIQAIDPYLTGSDCVVDNMAVLLEKYANDMENLVRKRTANLQQRTLELEEERGRTQTLLKDLKAAKEVAEAAAASKQSFLANMSHEIRTPMNAVIGMSRMLMESDLPPDLYECAETIESSGNHLMALIDDILDYSKIESGKLALERSLLDLTFVIESAMKLVSPNYLSKGLVLWYDIDAEVPIHVYGDLVRLRQILLNLLSNAFKFTERGIVAVHVEVDQGQGGVRSSASDDEDREAERHSNQYNEPPTSPSLEDYNPQEATAFLFSVSDTGIGIPKNKAKKLFKSFSQVDASTTRNFGGTGLGLAISQRLCRLMGGDMWVESDFGEGSTFYFRVMLQTQADGPTYGEQNHLSILAQHCPQPMVIAERPLIQTAWTNILSGIGLSHALVLDFEKASQFLQSERRQVSLLIVDVDLDTISSIEPQPTTSEATLASLQTSIPSTASLPALCIKDVRLRAKTTLSSRQPTTDCTNMTQYIQRNSDVPTTPQDDESASGLLSRVLSKPFRNSNLIMLLYQLLVPVDTASETPQERLRWINPIQPLLRRPDAIQQRSDSCSSIDPSKHPHLMSEGLQNVRTLLVDDNPVNQKVLSRMLGILGMTPSIAQNGREACEAIEQAQQSSEPISLVFMDIWMPEMNGLEAAQKIRKDLAASPTCPYIIAMTACVMPGDKEKCIEAGMNGYVSKPVRKEELEAAIHTYTQIASCSKGSADEYQPSYSDEG